MAKTHSKFHLCSFKTMIPNFFNKRKKMEFLRSLANTSTSKQKYNSKFKEFEIVRTLKMQKNDQIWTKKIS